MLTRISLQDLTPGLYHLIPEPEILSGLQNTLRNLGRSVLVFPPIITDYLVADTVRREVAFDFENQGLALGALAAAVEQTIMASILNSHHERAPRTLSGGERQLLALTVALQQPHEFLIGQNCFDFVSVSNVVRIKEQLIKHSKCLLNITHHEEQTMLNRYIWNRQTGYLEITTDSSQAQRVKDWLPVATWSLRISELRKTHPSSQFNLCIDSWARGDIRCLGILGDNGSGKSTLADCVSGLSEYKGSIDIHTSNTGNPRIGYLVQQAETPTIGLDPADMFHRFELQGRMSVQDQTRFQLFLRSSPTYHLISDLDAATGYRQMIVAALFAGDYDLLLLDEPTYGLPAESVVAFLLECVQSFKAKPLVLVSHDINFLRSLCDAIIELNEGEIV